MVCCTAEDDAPVDMALAIFVKGGGEKIKKCDIYGVHPHFKKFKK
jgi:hypothetical protein